MTKKEAFIKSLQEEAIKKGYCHCNLKLKCPCPMWNVKRICNCYEAFEGIKKH